MSLGLSLFGNRGLAAKDILLDLAGGCFGSSDTTIEDRRMTKHE